VLFHALRNQVQILNHLADGYDLLMAEDDTRETDSALLPTMSFAEKVTVKSDDDPVECRGTVQEIRVP
jgi:hypothetical protein